jgi:hypothetical protein
MKPPAEGVYLPEGHLNLRAKSQELRAIFMAGQNAQNSGNFGKTIYNKGKINLLC